MVTQQQLQHLQQQRRSLQFNRSRLQQNKRNILQSLPISSIDKVSLSPTQENEATPTDNHLSTFKQQLSEYQNLQSIARQKLETLGLGEERKSVKDEIQDLERSIDNTQRVIQGIQNNPSYGNKPSEQRTILRAQRPGITTKEVMEVLAPEKTRAKREREQNLQEAGLTIEQARNTTPGEARTILGQNRPGISQVRIQESPAVQSGYSKASYEQLSPKERRELDVFYKEKPPQETQVGIGRKGEQIIITKGKTTTAGERIQQLQNQPFNPTIGQHKQLQNKIIGTIQGQNINLGPGITLIDQKGNKKQIKSLNLLPSYGSDQSLGIRSFDSDGTTISQMVPESETSERLRAFESFLPGLKGREERLGRILKPYEQFASYATLGFGKPISERGFLGGVAQGTTQGLSEFFTGVGFGAIIASATEKSFLNVGGLLIPEIRRSTIEESKRSFKEGTVKELNDPRTIVSTILGLGLARGFAEVTGGSKIGKTVEFDLLGEGAPEIVEVVGSRVRTSVLDVGGLREVPGESIIPAKSPQALAIIDDPFLLRQKPQRATIPGSVRTTLIEGLPVIRKMEATAPSEAPIDYFIVRTKTSRAIAEGPTSARPTNLPSDVLGISKTLPTETVVFATTPQQAQRYIPPFGMEEGGPIKPLQIVRIEEGMSPKGLQRAAATTTDVEFFGVPKVVEPLETGAKKHVNLDLLQLGFEVKKIGSSVKTSEQLETLQPFNLGTGDFFALNPGTGEFLLARATEGRRFPLGAREIPGRRTVSIGVLPEAVATQKNLPPALFEEFLQTPKGLKFREQATGIKIIKTRKIVPGKKIGTTKPIIFGNEDNQVTTSQGTVLLLEPTQQETKTQQKTEQVLATQQKSEALSISQNQETNLATIDFQKIKIDLGKVGEQRFLRFKQAQRGKQSLFPITRTKLSTTQKRQQTTQDLLQPEQQRAQLIGLTFAKTQQQAQQFGTKEAQLQALDVLQVSRLQQDLFTEQTRLSLTKTKIQQRTNLKPGSENVFKKLSPTSRVRLEKAYAVFVKNRGKFVKTGVGLTRGEAVSFGARKTLGTLGATFRVTQEGMTSKKDFGVDRGVREYFREYRIRQGRKILTPDTFIQKRGKRLVTSQERNLLQLARKKGGGFL